MSGRLRITLNRVPGELSRVLTLIERRRFRIENVETYASGASTTTTLDIELADDGRNLRNLTKQLVGLACVLDVQHSQTDLQ